MLVLYGEHDLFFDVDKVIAQARHVLPCLVAAEAVAKEGHVWGQSASQQVYKRISAFLREQQVLIDPSPCTVSSRPDSRRQAAKDHDP